MIARRPLAALLLMAVLAAPFEPWIGNTVPRVHAQSPRTEDVGWTVVVDPDLGDSDNRAGATVTDATAAPEMARAVVSVENRTGLDPFEGTSGSAARFVLGTFGLTGAYSLWVTPGSGENVWRVSGSYVLLPRGTHSVSVTAQDPGQPASQTLVADISVTSTAVDIALIAVDVLLGLAMPAVPGCVVSGGWDIEILVLSIAPEFLAMITALQDGRLADATNHFGAALLRAAPRVGVAVARILERCGEMLLVGAVLGVLSGGLVLVIKIALIVVRQIPTIVNYVWDVFVTETPPTVVTIAYQPPPELVGIPPPGEPPPVEGEGEAPPAPPPIAGADTSTVLVQDVSGSMAGEQLLASVQAARNIVDLVSWDAESTGTYHQIGVVAFESSSHIVVPMTADAGAVRAGLSRLATSGGTNMGAGLADALALLDIGALASHPVIILLSDGKNNEGLSNQQVLAGPVADAAARGICIYTVGFGLPGDLDEPFLREVAARTGCGEYNYAAGGFSLESAYIQVRHSSAGGVLRQVTGTISEGERESAGEIMVPPDQRELQLSLNWPGSLLRLAVTDPAGQQVDDEYPGAHLNTQPRLAHLIVTEPLAGTWTIDVVGVDVPGKETRFTLVASVRAADQPRGADFAVVRSLVSAYLVALFAIGIGAYMRTPAREDDP